jgi:hypothetical protein
MVEEILLNSALGVKNHCLAEHHQLTSWNSPSEANGSLASGEIHHILQNLKVHNCIHKSHPPSSVLSQINPVHAPHLTSCRSILILSSCLYVGLQSGFLPSSLPTKTQCACLLSPIHSMCPSNLILELITWILVRSTHHEAPCVVVSNLWLLFLPKCILSTLLSNTINLSVRDQVLYPYKTSGRIIVLYTVIFMFFDGRLEDKRLGKHSMTLVRT